MSVGKDSVHSLERLKLKENTERAFALFGRTTVYAERKINIAEEDMVEIKTKLYLKNIEILIHNDWTLKEKSSIMYRTDALARRILFLIRFCNETSNFY